MRWWPSTSRRGGWGWPAERTMPYDYLVLATGATHSYFGHDEWAPLAPGLKTVEDATEIRRRVLLAFELAERQMVEHGWHPPLNFVVIGGGPTGVELAGAISDIAQLYMRHDFRHIDPAQEPGAAAGWRAADAGGVSRRTCPQRRRRSWPGSGVEVHTGVPVTGSGPGVGGNRRTQRHRPDRGGGDAMGGRSAGFAPGQAAGRAARQARVRHGGRPAQSAGVAGRVCSRATWRTLTRTGTRCRALRSRPCRWGTMWAG